MGRLWSEAADLLDKDSKAHLHALLGENHVSQDEVITLVQNKRQACLDSRFRLTRSSGKVIYARDVFDKLAKWLDKFKQVGDVAVQVDPVHATIPWAVVRFLLTTATNDLESFSAVAEGLELVTCEVSRCTAIEVCMIDRPQTKTRMRDHLERALLAVYKAILIYLIEAARYYSNSTAKRMLKSIGHASPALVEQLDKVQAKADEVHRMMHSITAEVTVSAEHNAQKMLNIIQSFDDKLSVTHDLALRITDTEKSQQRKAMLNWVSEVEYWVPFRENIRDIAPDTSIWLQDKAEYRHWHGTDVSTVFWLRGRPGFGKTKLLSACVRSLFNAKDRGDNRAAIAYFYAPRDTSLARDLDAARILRTLVRQLLPDCPQVLSDLERIYFHRGQEIKEHGLDAQMLSLDETRNTLLLLAEEKPLAIFVDGVDELSSSAEGLMEALEDLVMEATLPVKVMITSRSAYSPGLSLKALVYDIKSDDCAADIANYVQYAVPKAIQEKKLLGGDVSKELQTRIEKHLSVRSEGMFLWAKLQLMQFCNGRRYKVQNDVLIALTRPPEGITLTYQRMFDQFSDYGSHAKKVLQSTFAWLLAAQRPLSTSTFLHAVSQGEKIDVDTVLDICGNFIVYNEAAQRFDFIHLSAREYIQSRPELDESGANALIFWRCITQYLPTEQDSGHYLPDFGQDDSNESTEAFRIYATLYWPRHYSKVSRPNSREEACEAIARLAFEGEGIFFETWLADVEGRLDQLATWDELRQQLDAVRSNTDSPIFAACVFDLRSIGEEVLRRIEDSRKAATLAETNKQGASPVYLSARNGTTEILRILLNAGAKIDDTGGYFQNPLQAALFFGHCDAARMLLEQGANPNLPGKFAHSFDAAFAGGSEEAVNLLVERSLFDVMSADRVLEEATKLAFDKVVRTIASSHSTTNTEASDKAMLKLQTALQYGSYTGAQLWMSRIANINSTAGFFGNALQAAVFGGYQRCVKLVLSAGADVSLKGRYGSPLRVAALLGRDSIINLLITKGARDSTQSKECAIAAAASRGSVSTVRTLVDVEYPREDVKKLYELALQAACAAGSAEICSILFDWVKPTVFDLGEDTALKMAFSYSRLEIISMFIERFPDISAMCRGRLIFQSMGKGPSLIERSCASQDKDRSHRYSTPSDEEQFDKKYSGLLGVSRMEIAAHCDNGDIMRLAARLGSVDIIEHLLARGVSAGGREDRDTFIPKAKPIEIAAAYGHVNAVMTLYRSSKELSRALVFAVRFARQKVIRAILENVADCEVDLPGFDKLDDPLKDYKREQYINNSPMALAIEMDNAALFRTLLEYRAKSCLEPPKFALIVAAQDDRIKYLSDLLDCEELWQGIGIADVVNEDADSKSLSTDNGMPSIYESDDESEGWLDNSYPAQDPPKLLKLAAQEAGSKRSVKALQALLNFSLIRSPLQLLSLAIERAAAQAADIIPILVEECSSNDVDARNLLDLGLSAAIEADRTYLNPKRFATDSVFNIFTRFTEKINMNAEAHRICVAKHLNEMSKLGRLDLLQIALSHVDRSARVLRHKPCIMSHLISQGFISNHDTHAELGNIAEALISHGAAIDIVYQAARHEPKCTPVALSCLYGISDAFFVLADAGADLFQLSGVPSSVRTGINFSTSHNTTEKHLNLVDFALLGLSHGDISKSWQSPITKRFGDIIYFLMHAGVPPNIRSRNFATLCQIVSFQGNRRYMTLILQFMEAQLGHANKASINMLEGHGVLHAAARGAQTDMTDFWLQMGLSVRTKTEVGKDREGLKTATRAAMPVLRDGTGRITFDEDADTVAKKTHIFTRFLEEGVDDEDRLAIFKFAALHGQIDLCSSSLGQGLTHVEDPEWSSFLCSVVERNKGESIKMLMGNQRLLPATTTDQLAQACTRLVNVAMFDCAGFDSSFVNKNYIQEMMGPDLDGYKSRTNLFSRALLSKHCTLEEIHTILNLGADWSLPGLNMSAVSFLAESCNVRTDESLPSLLDLLLKSGSDVNDCKTAHIRNDPVYDSPLHVAIRSNGKHHLLEALISHGADINRNGGFGSPLHHARLFQNEDAVQLLIENSAKDTRGRYNLAELALLRWPVPRDAFYYEPLDQQMHTLVHLSSKVPRDKRKEMARQLRLQYVRAGDDGDNNLDSMPRDWYQGSH